MSQFISQIQLSDSENHLSSPISTPYNPQDAVLPHESYSANEDTYHVTYAAQAQQAIQTPVIDTPVHPTVFFFRPPNDFYHYHVICKEITYDAIEHLLNKSLNGNNVSFNENECTFFYQQKFNNRFYQISCEIVSPLLVNDCLSMHFLGFELQHQNMEQESLAFTFYQKAHLEDHLK